MRRTRAAAVAAVAIAPLGLMGAAQAHEGHSHSSHQSHDHGDEHATGRVNFMLHPINGSGASADATITVLASGAIHVQVEGSGFTPNSPHAQHLHGGLNGHEFFCPTPDADTNGDGQISTEEGVPQYGGVMVSLTTRGDVSMDSGLAVDRFPVADAQGNLSYDRVIPARMIPDGVVDNLQHLHIVQHGLDVNGNGKYDTKALGESVFAKSLGIRGIPEEATNPATCGEVTPVGGVETGGAPPVQSDSAGSLPLVALGGLAAAGAAGSLVLRRRLRTEDH